MMNRSAIDWCDYSWNPVTGCRHGCPYCYARKQARRFCGDIRLNLASDQIRREEGGYIIDRPFKSDSGTTLPYPTGFAPTFYEYRLPMPAQKKKRANIFVCSMADLFGEWVPDEWIRKVFDACCAAPQHNYMFLTKNPERYSRLADEGRLPENDNFWYGSTVTIEGDACYSGDDRRNTFVSMEPLLGPVAVPDGVKWVIVGAETGNRKDKVEPQRSWIEDIVRAAAGMGVPVLLKHSKELHRVWKSEMIQKYPGSLQHPLQRR